jgi:hypothetical protein
LGSDQEVSPEPRLELMIDKLGFSSGMAFIFSTFPIFLQLDLTEPLSRIALNLS